MIVVHLITACGGRHAPRALPNKTPPPRFVIPLIAGLPEWTVRPSDADRTSLRYRVRTFRLSRSLPDKPDHYEYTEEL